MQQLAISRSTLPHRALEHNKFPIESQFYNSECIYRVESCKVKKKLQKIQQGENFSEEKKT